MNWGNQKGEPKGASGLRDNRQNLPREFGQGGLQVALGLDQPPFLAIVVRCNVARNYTFIVQRYVPESDAKWQPEISTEKASYGVDEKAEKACRGRGGERAKKTFGRMCRRLKSGTLFGTLSVD